MKDEFIKAAKELEEQIIRDRRHIHKYPEVGMEAVSYTHLRSYYRGNDD